MQARLTTVEAEEAQQKEELNTFYLMWAGHERALLRPAAPCTPLHPAAPRGTTAHSRILPEEACVRLL